MVNLVNAERISIAFGTRTLLDEVSLGPRPGRRGRCRRPQRRRQDHAAAAADRRTRAGLRPGDAHRSDLRSATCARPTTSRPTATVRDVIVGGEPDHVWAAQAGTRAVVEHLLAGIDLDRRWSSAQRRRAAAGRAGRAAAGRPRPAGAGRADQPPRRRGGGLAGRAAARPAGPRPGAAGGQPRPLVPGRDLHPDLGGPRRRRRRYDGGYAAYVLARAERARQAAGVAARRKNLLRKELAWLRRGPPARTAQAEVPDRRGQRADRRRAAAAGPAGAAAVRHPPAGQGRLRPQPGRRHAARRRAGAVPRPQLVDRAGERIGLVGVERLRQDHPAAAAARRAAAGLRARSSGAGPCSRLPQPDGGRAPRVGAGAGVGRAAAPRDPAGHRPGGQRRHAAGGLRLHRRAADHPARTTSPAASGDGCSSFGCCWPSRTCCCSTSRPTTWTSTP